MKTLLISFLSGFLFALGLGISGMTQADKVIAFLDLAGGWDPSLAFVMIGAIGTHAAFRWLIMKRDAPVWGPRFRLPSRQDVDGTLLGGAALFGVGWALGGYCPGPGIVSVASGAVEPLVFVAMATVGMLLWQVTPKRRPHRASHRVNAPS
ncbi:MAG: DUF6691 family protein [Myxococcota bacterium]